MAHPNYRDEPNDDRAFTEEEENRMRWTQAWRIRFHEYEQALYQQQDVRHGLVEGLIVREVATIYEND